ncbi:MAG: hypothetical protein HY423_16780 [Candidatus Lambdaproteobacteria bacterium]|nr:hypothetical protein [Candidatus Lambdaproteobacteria bacterium]
MTALMSLDDARVLTDEGTPLGPISWQIESPARIWLECADPAHYEPLVALLTGRRRPSGGMLHEYQHVVVQTDRHLREQLDLRLSIGDFLRSREAPAYVWLGQRRRTLQTLVDRLGLSPSDTRRPLKLEPPAVVAKYLALRFVISRAHLLIGRELFVTPDPQVREVLRQRWPDFPAAVIACCPAAALPGPAQWHAVLDAGGRFTCTRLDPAAGGGP